MRPVEGARIPRHPARGVGQVVREVRVVDAVEVPAEAHGAV